MVLAVMFIVPVILLLCGLWLWLWPPKERNRFFGYRTRASMESRESWELAQRNCGRLWIVLGSVMLGVCVLLALLAPKQSRDPLFACVAACLESFFACATILPLEKKLKASREKGDAQ